MILDPSQMGAHEMRWFVFFRANGADEDSPGLSEARPWESNILFEAPCKGARDDVASATDSCALTGRLRGDFYPGSRFAQPWAITHGPFRAITAVTLPSWHYSLAKYQAAPLPLVSPWMNLPGRVV